MTDSHPLWNSKDAWLNKTRQDFAGVMPADWCMKEGVGAVGKLLTGAKKPCVKVCEFDIMMDQFACGHDLDEPESLCGPQLYTRPRFNSASQDPAKNFYCKKDEDGVFARACSDCEVS